MRSRLELTLNNNNKTNKHARNGRKVEKMKEPMFRKLPSQCVDVSDELYDALERMKWEVVNGKK